MNNFIHHVLKKGDEKITSLFGNREFYMNDKLVKDYHNGLDLIDRTSKYDYIIAYDDGIVIEIRDNIKGFDEKNGAGNYVEIKHDDKYSTRYHHIAYGTIRVRVGDIVQKGDIIGYIGETGYVTGAHIHFCIKENGKYVNPLPFLEEENTIFKKKLGEPISRDEFNNQIEVKINNLRVRDNPNGNILGYINPGIYNFLETKKVGEYNWYKINDNMWIAYDDSWVIIYNKKEIIVEDKVKNDEYKLIYECTRDDTYAIKLYAGEKIYIKKS